jgi:hypothetical protein
VLDLPRYPWHFTDGLIDMTHIFTYLLSDRKRREGRFRNGSVVSPLEREVCSTELLCMLLAYHTSTRSRYGPRCSGSEMMTVK